MDVNQTHCGGNSVTYYTHKIVTLYIKINMGREEGSGWGTHVYLWLIHLDIWQNQYNIVKLNKIKFKKIKKERKKKKRIV